MANQIEFREIPLFSYLEADAREYLVEVFHGQRRQQGEYILTFQEKVPGIYLILEGEAIVKVPNMEKPLAILKRGQCVGDMSLIEANEKASAHVIVHSPELKLLFCSIDDFNKMLVNIPGSAFGFYKGAALMLSSRLRHIDSKLSEEITLGRDILSEIIDSSSLTVDISQTRSDLADTGGKVVSKLMDVMPILDRLIQKHPELGHELTGLAKKIEDVFLIDSQNFDRISQQLDQILQHFENMQRLASGGSVVPVSGDRNLFSRSKKTG